MKTRMKQLALMLLALFFFAACNNAKNDKDVIKIGAILPLTGSASSVGEFQKNGIEVAVSEVNEMGGINGKKVEVIFGDSKNEGKEGLAVLKKMVELDKVKVFIASQSGVVVPLAKEISDNKDLLLFITISSYPEVTKLGDNIFRFYVTSDNESKKMADFTYNKLGIKNAGVFYINDDFGISGLKTFRNKYIELGGKVVWDSSYEKTGSDFKTSLLKATNSKMEALYIIGYDKAFAIAVKQVREVGIKLPILASIGMSVPEWINIAGESAEGIYVTATRFEPGSNNPKIKTFVEKYNKQFGKDPNMLAAFTYDSFKLIIEAFSKGANSPQELAEKLKKTNNYEGTIGNISFDISREGNIDLIIRKISDGKPVYYCE
jgi:branched-chain amino acid transport system substrate-binding protein